VHIPAERPLTDKFKRLIVDRNQDEDMQGRLATAALQSAFSLVGARGSGDVRHIAPLIIPYGGALRDGPDAARRAVGSTNGADALKVAILALAGHIDLSKVALVATAAQVQSASMPAPHTRNPLDPPVTPPVRPSGPGRFDKK